MILSNVPPKIKKPSFWDGFLLEYLKFPCLIFDFTTNAKLTSAILSLTNGERDAIFGSEDYGLKCAENKAGPFGDPAFVFRVLLSELLSNSPFQHWLGCRQVVYWTGMDCIRKENTKNTTTEKIVT